MSQRRLSFAPLEGVTGWVFRRVHRARFPGLDRYYAPFFAPTVDSPLTGRGLTDLLPEHNQGVPVVPQLLANRAEAFLAAAQVLADLGYEEVNLNLGCPSGTVVAKGKGAGFLSQPQALDAFLDEVFRRTPLAVSIKTRIGVTDEGEWPALLAVFGRYPIRELIVHPRLRRDFYRGPVRRQAFQYAVYHCSLPLCYNGDLFSPAACQEAWAAWPSVEHLMAGRGLVHDPALGRRLQGGQPLALEEFRAFHDQLVEEYRQVLSGDRPVLGKMKELWFYWAPLFAAPEKPLKRIRKAKNLAEYRDGANALFRDHPFQPEAGWHSPGG